MSLDTTSSVASPTGTETPARVACASAAVLALVPFALCSFSGETGEQITASLLDHAVALQLGAGVAAVAGALLVVAAARLGGHVFGTAGRVMGMAGAGVAILFVAYYASYGAGAVVADTMLTEPGPGVGEGTALLVNMTELARYAPGLALTGAAVAARRQLPVGVWGSGAALAVLTLVPLTSWAAALAIPLWLGISAAALRPHVQVGRQVP